MTFFIHFKATFLKRLRVIRRDSKSFAFELILPFIIILLSLFLLRVSFITDFDARAITVNTYLSDQNPVLIPIGSDSAAHTANMQSSIATKYGASVTVDADTANTAVGNFDLLFLFPKKTAIPTLKGGVFFTNTTIPSGGNTLYEYYTLVNTKSPTSPFFLENIATETILNQVFNKSVTI